MKPWSMSRLPQVRPVLTIIILNSIIALLWGASAAFAKVGIPYFMPMSGAVAWLAPGVCLTFLLEQMSESRLSFILFFFWVMLFSLILTPSAVFLVSQIWFKQLPVTQVILPFLIWWAITILAAIIVSTLKRQPIMLDTSQQDSRTRKELGVVAIAYITVLVINFVLYPLLPEGDGYALLIKWTSIQANPLLLLGETRIPFLVLINLIAQLLHLAPYWVLKVILPLGNITLVLSAYLFARQFIRDSRYRVLLALSPLFFPVILQEILIGRPQSVVLIAFLPSIMIIAETLKDQKSVRAVYWLFALLIISTIGIKIHTLFVLISFVSSVSIILFLWPEIKKHPLDSFIIICALFTLIAPNIIHSRFIPDTKRLIELFATALSHSHFEWWFIDHYKNVDGAEVGWPGILSLFYYGYNAGLVFPAIFILSLMTKKITSLRQLWPQPYWAIVFLFAFLLFIAEIAPRFQIAYLPDRAWLFLSLTLVFMVPVLVAGLVKQGWRYFFIFFFVLCAISLGAGTWLTYAKQGWVTTDEVAAAEFIKTQTPPNAVFLTQGGTRMMVRYYTKRAAIHAPGEIFLTGEKQALDAYLDQQAATNQAIRTNVTKQRVLLSDELQMMAQTLVQSTISNDQLEKIFATLVTIQEQKVNYFVSTDALEDSYPAPGSPIYLIYNQNKFDSLYGKRSWWRISNFYGAKIDRLNQNYPVVYSKNGVTIWQAGHAPSSL